MPCAGLKRWSLRILVAMLAVVAGLVGAGTAWAPTALPLVTVGARAEAGAPKAHLPAYGAARSAYDAPMLLGSPSSATAGYLRDTPSESVAIHRGRFASFRGGGGAANAESKLLSPGSLADEVANATGEALKTNKGGFTVEIPNGSRGITVRVMERGGSRISYYRVSVPGKATYTVTGEASTDAALTHMDIGESSLDDILSIIARIQGAG